MTGNCSLYESTTKYLFAPFLLQVRITMTTSFDPLFAMLNKPSGYADYAAITAFGLAWGTYFLKGKAWDRPDPYHHVWFEKPQIADAAASDRVKETRDIAQKLQETVRRS